MAEKESPESKEVEHSYLDVGPSGPRRCLLVVFALVVLVAIIAAFFGLYIINRGASPTLTPDPGLLTQAALADVQRLDDATSVPAPLLASTASLSSPTVTAQALTYTVQTGDTLIGIAQRFNVDLDDLTALNQLSGETILPDQILVVPPTVTPLPESGPFSHTVSQGETLIEISALYNVTVDQLKALNGLTSDTILVGQQILIPAGGVRPPTPTPTPEPWAPAVITGELDAVYSLATIKGHFTLHIPPDTRAASAAETAKVARLVETALHHSQTAIQRVFPGRFEVYISDNLFEAPYTAQRSFALPDIDRLFLLYDGSGTPVERAYFATYALTKLVAAHLLGEPASPLLAEGLAVYAAGQALAAEASQGRSYLSPLQFCAAFHQAGELPRLADFPEFKGHLGYSDQHLSAGCFVQYLIETADPSAFRQVYLSGDYQNVYDKTLKQLVSDWTDALREAAENSPFDSDELVRLTTAVNDAYRNLWAGFEGTPAQFAAYERLDRARLALLQGRLETAQHHLEMLEELLE